MEDGPVVESLEIIFRPITIPIWQYSTTQNYLRKNAVQAQGAENQFQPKTFFLTQPWHRETWEQKKNENSLLHSSNLISNQ